MIKIIHHINHNIANATKRLKYNYSLNSKQKIPAPSAPLASLET